MLASYPDYVGGGKCIVVMSRHLSVHHVLLIGIVIANRRQVSVCAAVLNYIAVVCPIQHILEAL